MTERVVLAYSGGLDTSVAVRWLMENAGAEVIAVAVDVGQSGDAGQEDWEAIRSRAFAAGAVEATVVDARAEMAEDFCMPALLANANDVVAQVKSGQGTLGKIIYDEALHHQAAGAMTNLNQILEKVNTGDGTVSQLINTNSMLKDVKLSLQKLNKATESLEDTGPLSILGTMVNSLF